MFTTKMPAPSVAEPPSTLTGTVDTAFGGKSTTTLATAAACPDSFVRPSKLVVRAKRTGTRRLRVRATVTTTILGDTRPVRHARVIVAGRRALTNDAGVAVIRLKQGVRRGLRDVAAFAGDTLDPGRTRVRLPRRAR